jgi:hypothetical protein
MSTSGTKSDTDNIERQIHGEKKGGSKRLKDKTNLSDAEGKNEKDQRNKISSRKTKKDGKPIFAYKAVKVLILTFEFQDLDLEEETTEVENAFGLLNYDVEKYAIKMVTPLEQLKKKLERFFFNPKSIKTLHIIYYHGHGGLEHHENYGSALSLTRWVSFSQRC